MSESNAGSDDDLVFLRRALAAARRASAAGNGPFGAVIVRDGQVLAEAGNTVGNGPDVTAHAEINALRQAGEAAGAIHLTGAVIYTSTEPCPMCFAAVHWADIKRIVFSTYIADAAAAGFRELPLSNEFLSKAAGLKDLEIRGGLLLEEGRTVFAEHLNRPVPLRY